MVTPVYKRPLGASGMKGVRDTTTTKHNTTEEVAEETTVVSVCDGGGLAMVTVIRQGEKSRLN